MAGDSGNEDCDWASMMAVEEVGDAIDGKAEGVVPAAPAATAPPTAPAPAAATPAPELRQRKAHGTSSRRGGQGDGGAAVHAAKGEVGKVTRKGPQTETPLGPVQQFMDRYQWLLLAGFLIVWTTLFMREMGSWGRVYRDKLWWIGVLGVSMVLSLSYRRRDTSRLSAYSICNEGCVAIPGSMNTDALLGIHRPGGHRSGGGGNDSAPARATTTGLDADLLAALESGKFGRNDDCPCGSGAKFKTCCAALQQRIRAARARGEVM